MGAISPALNGSIRATLLTALVLISAASHTHPPVLIALVYLLLSYLRSDRRLEVLSLVSLVVFLIRTYYDLSSPLAVRAGWLAMTGGLVLALAWWMSRTDPEVGADEGMIAPAQGGKVEPKRLSWRSGKALAAALALALALPVLLRWRKEPSRGADAVDLGMDTFFFAEGEGERYARSGWAEVALDPDGEAMVVDLVTD